MYNRDSLTPFTMRAAIPVSSLKGLAMTFVSESEKAREVKTRLFDNAPTGVNKKCKVRIAAHTAILKFDRRVALRSAMPAAFLCRQCIPASLHRAATSVLQADSIMPDPM